MPATESLSSVIDSVFTNFTFDPESEITIEANPCDLTLEKISALKDMGFNRVSLGVQSFDDSVLSFLGRAHTAGQAETALVNLRSHGFENISIDLIYGFEGQPIRDWINTLSRAISFNPEHLSCYQLTIEKKTMFWRLKDRGLFQPLSEEDERSFFLATSQFLEDNGYIHYEVSSFAREKKYYSLHNCKYWNHTPYLGLGPAAHSFRGTRRWWNVSSVRTYCEALEHGRVPIEDSEILTNEQVRFESIMLGLRTRDGLDQDIIMNNHRSRKMLREFQAAGFIRVNNSRVIPTRKGLLVADYLASSL